MVGVSVFDSRGSHLVRVYALDAVSKWAMPDPTIFTFWHKPPTTPDAAENPVRVRGPIMPITIGWNIAIL